MQQMIYFDSAATSLPKPQEVAKAMVDALGSMGNAGRGVNEASFNAARTVFQVRTQLMKLFGGEDPSCFAFTSNSTEALNTAIKGTLEPGNHVITTVLEHNSVLRPLFEMRDRGVEVTYLPCSAKGMVYPDQFREAIKENTRAIICTHASNVTGNVLDIKTIGQIAHERGLLFIVDASQTAGYIPINVQDMNIDILCFTGHKSLLGPQGTGGIYVKKGLIVRPLKSGGSGVQTYNERHPSQMPTALEAGTLNGHGIAGLGAALSFIERVGLENIQKKEAALMLYFYDKVSKIPGITIYGDFSLRARCPIVSLNINRLDSAVAGDELFNTYGISVRTGAHCAPLMHKALGTTEQGAVRFSFSQFNTKEEIDKAIDALKELV